MRCSDFERNVVEYIEGKLTEDKSHEIREHLSICGQCADLYEKNLRAYNGFNKYFAQDSLYYKSKKDEIFSNIDRDRYAQSIAQKSKYKVERHRLRYITTFALLIVFIMAMPFLQRFMNKSDIKVSDNVTINVSKDKTVISNMKRWIKSTIFAEGNIVSPKITTATDKSEIMKVLNEISTLPQGVTEWKVIYGDNEKIIFYNYSHILACDITNSNLGIYYALDLRRLDVGSIQGDNVLTINTSPNGRYLLIGTGVSNKGEKGRKLYLVDTDNGRAMTIEDEYNFFDLITSWSSDSRYFSYVNKEGGVLKIYDSETFLYKEVETPKEPVESITVSVNGRVFIDGTSIYETTKNFSGIKKTDIEGAILGSYSNDIFIYNKGHIFSYNIEKDVNYNKSIVANVNGEYILKDSSDKGSTFISQNALGRFNFKEKRFYEFKGLKVRDNEYISWSDDNKCIVNDMVVDLSGKVYKYEEAYMLYGAFKDSNTLIRIESNFDGGKGKLGDFEVQLVDLMERSVRVIYRLNFDVKEVAIHDVDSLIKAGDVVMLSGSDNIDGVYNSTKLDQFIDNFRNGKEAKISIVKAVKLSGDTNYTIRSIEELEIINSMIVSRSYSKGKEGNLKGTIPFIAVRETLFKSINKSESSDGIRYSYGRTEEEVKSGMGATILSFSKKDMK